MSHCLVTQFVEGDKQTNKYYPYLLYLKGISRNPIVITTRAPYIDIVGYCKIDFPVISCDKFTQFTKIILDSEDDIVGISLRSVCCSHQDSDQFLIWL